MIVVVQFDSRFNQGYVQGQKNSGYVPSVLHVAMSMGHQLPGQPQLQALVKYGHQIEQDARPWLPVISGFGCYKLCHHVSV